uniref:Putative F-box/FBD/LRR-repeat protein n=1 Tax=Noccaea caerulescens TaxID=107243 RepID=A0A1J3EQI3_NOCCA
MAGRDRISDLPECLLTQILSYLPTKDSVKTSLLSKRWESVWLRVPGLDLRFYDFPDVQAMESFIDQFLKVNKYSQLQKFEIESKNDGFLVSWICRADGHVVHHLDVSDVIRKAPNVTQSIYRSNTLVSLKLVSVRLETPKCSVYLPCLKIMYSEDVWYDYDDPLTMEKTIAGCPALEDLTVIISRPWLDESFERNFLKHLRVRSQILKRFRLMFEDRWGGRNCSVEIDAPSLEYMSFSDNQSAKIVVKNLSSLVMVDIDCAFKAYFGESFLLQGRENISELTIHDFFAGISGVRHMIISRPTLQVLCRYSELGKIPKFEYLYRLQAKFSCDTLRLLPKFLESCINLEDLIVDFDAVSMFPMKIELTYVPRCLIMTLECVEINKLKWNEELGMKLVNYFLENSVILKKLTVSFIDSPVSNQEREIYRKLLTTRKRSGRCQVSIY